MARGVSAFNIRLEQGSGEPKANHIGKSFMNQEHIYTYKKMLGEAYLYQYITSRQWLIHLTTLMLPVMGQCTDNDNTFKE
jgi:hypothetical protein